MVFKKITTFISRYFNPLDYADREDYYQNRLYPQSPFVISELFENYEKAVLTPVEIHYEQIKWHRSEISLIKNLGEPNYIFNQEYGKCQYNVLFNKDNVGGYDILRQTHFIDNIFFYACNTYKTIALGNKQTVKNNILKQYQCVQYNSEANTVKLIDVNYNKILITEDVYLRVCYMSGDEEIDKLLINFFN